MDADGDGPFVQPTSQGQTTTRDRGVPPVSATVVRAMPADKLSRSLQTTGVVL